jgi:hypothetical protein
MGKYADHYFIEYKDTIRLHFDKKVETAWLTLKNYGVVFGAVAGVSSPLSPVVSEARTCG